MSYGIAIAIGFSLTYLFTGILQYYAPHIRLVDIPNERSSHNSPTPRGAGLVFTTIFLLLFGWLVPQDMLNIDIILTYIATTSILAVVGLLDDWHNISAKFRFGCHLSVVAILLAVINVNLQLGYGVWLLGFLWLSGTWLINLYNFMDGIDGLAAIELLSVGTILLIEIHFIPGNAQLILPITLMMSCIAGFILWNWAPAKIFMGDIGSSVIGFFFFYLIMTSTMSLLTWGILLAGFWVDTTYTLLYRIMTGQKWYQAHRTHGYQKLAIRWRSHAKVSISMATINMIWLLPLSVGNIFYPAFKWGWVFLAISPFLCFCYWIQAGKPLCCNIKETS